MPIYDFLCPKCKKKKLDEYLRSWNDAVWCDSCNTLMSRMYNSFPTPHVFPSEGIFLEHVSSEGHLFHSKKEMQQYAKKHDLQLGALE